MVKYIMRFTRDETEARESKSEFVLRTVYCTVHT